MKTFKFTDTLTGDYFLTPLIDTFKIHNYQNYDVDFLNWCGGRILKLEEF